MAKTKSKTAKSDVYLGKSDPAWDDGSAFPEISLKNENEVVLDAGISLKNENEIVLDAEISQVREDGQITLFYDSLGEPPEPADFTSTEAYNQAYQDWQQKHPDLANHGFTPNLDKPEIGTLCTITKKHKKYIGEPGYVCAYHQDDSPEFWVKLDNHDLQLRCLPEQISVSLKNHRGFAIGDRIVDLKNKGRTGTIKILRSDWLVASWDNQKEGIYYYEYVLKIGDSHDSQGQRIYSKTEQRSGVVVSVGRSGFSIEWQGWLKSAYSFSQIEELQLSKVEEIEPCDNSMSVPALGLDSALPAYKQDGNSSAHQKLTHTVQISSTSVIPMSITTETLKTVPGVKDLDLNEEKSTLSQLPLLVPPSQSMVSDLGQQMKETVSPQSSNSLIDISPISQSSKTLLDCSPVPINQEIQGCISVISCNNFTEAGTMRNGFVSPAATLAPPSLENDYFWLPSPSALSSTGKGRPPGQNKQEAELKNLGLIAKGEVLNPVILSDWYNLPQTWLDPSESSPAIQLLEDRDRQQEIFSILESQRSQSKESAILSDSSTPTTLTKQQSDFKTGNYILNGRVGQVIEDSPNEYFTVKYGKNDLKCYFFGQDDELIDQLAIVPALTSQYAPQNLVDEFLRENSDPPKISPKKKKVASGSLAPYLENKKLKSGEIVTYPRVQGERDKFNHLHWKWGYYYEIKVNGEWKNRSLPTPARIVPQVKIMIENHCSVDEIKDFILQCKNKKVRIQVFETQSQSQFQN